MTARTQLLILTGILVFGMVTAHSSFVVMLFGTIMSVSIGALLYMCARGIGDY